MTATHDDNEVTLAEAREAARAAAPRLATRYACSLSDNEAAGHQHDSGNGKPPRKRCRGCGGTFHVYHGLWGVFEWEGGNRYREEDAAQTYTVEKRADARADTLNLTGPSGGAGGWVVRWIFKDTA
jgi:hypothetical protein